MPTIAQRVANTRRATLQSLILADAPSWYSCMSGRGTVLDLSPNRNHGTITLGTGTPSVLPLNHGGDGALSFDGVTTVVAVTDAAPLTNIWDAGGPLFALLSPTAAAFKRLYVKEAASLTDLRSAVGNYCVLAVQVGFSVTSGLWVTGTVFPIVNTSAIGITYNADDVANDPTVYFMDFATGGFQVLTVGAGLTEAATPVGVRNTDAAANLAIGHNGYAGVIDEFAIWKGRIITRQRMQAYMQAALGMA